MESTEQSHIELPDLARRLSVGGHIRNAGRDLFYSGHEKSESVRLLREAGFEVLHSAIDDPSSRGHLAVLARKGEVGHA